MRACYPIPFRERKRPVLRRICGKSRPHWAAGLAPTEVARQVFEAIRDERFYIATDPDE